MSSPQLSRAELVSRLLEMQKHGWPTATLSDVCRSMGENRSKLSHIVNYNCQVATPRIDPQNPETWTVGEPQKLTIAPAVERNDPALPERIVAKLKHGHHTVEALATALGVTPGQALDACYALKAAGKNIAHEGDTWLLHEFPVIGFVEDGAARFLLSDDNHVFRFGAVADSHLGSKYERLDCLNDIYDRFADEGITHVMHAGNWIEGEARFNRTDVSVHGMDAQLKYLAEKYPQRPGIQTWAVAGDDHEGWYGQREGIDIGKRAEQTMRDHGRTDWVNLGFMEAHVMLRNKQTGKEAVMAVVHPGGGSAYAESYVIQKIIESLDGGEKPALALYGHYHKCLAGDYRNVFWMLVPSTKDQDCFMRKKRISSKIGGAIIEVSQNPEDGALHSYKPWMFRYFNVGYYENRWNHAGPVTLPERAVR